MKTIGLIGGLSWESSIEYYRIINEESRRRRGGSHSAECLMFSFDFEEIERLQMAGDWLGMTRRMTEVARQLERGGAGCIVICSNTMHKMADAVQAAVDLPLLHIADATARAIIADGWRDVALLGTRFTMEQDFYKGHLIDRFGLKVRIPDAAGCAAVHRIIYDELVRGEVRAESRRRYQAVIAELQAAGAEAVIFGCTEISLLLEPGQSALPSYDTTRLHAIAAVEWALA